MVEQNIIIKGFQVAGTVAGIKKSGQKDLGLIFSERPATVCGVFTANKVKAAPVILDLERIGKGICRAVIVNSGNANACTGDLGLEHAKSMTKITAEALGIAEDQTLVASTGVIGQPLPIERITQAIPGLVKNLNTKQIPEFAESILTTDAGSKVSLVKDDFGGKEVVVCGVAKGAGMLFPVLEPPSATMLAFIMTDATVKRSFLNKIFLKYVEESFNSITVDGDTSTNDTALILANGSSGIEEIKDGTPEATKFGAMLKKVLLDLAKMMVKDGEGATKFVELCIKGARNDAEAKVAAGAVANSILVKTAFFGSDANWGRIIAAIGYSGAEFNPDKVDLFYNDAQLVSKGQAVGKMQLIEAEKVAKRREFILTVDLHQGKGKSTIYTTDLSYDYVKLNADYRT